MQTHRWRELDSNFPFRAVNEHRIVLETERIKRAAAELGIAGVAVGTAAGTVIPRDTPRHRGAAGTSAAVLAAAIATRMTIAAAICAHETTKAGSPAPGRRATMTTMTIGAAVAGMAAGTAIRKGTPRRHAAAAGNRLSI